MNTDLHTTHSRGFTLLEVLIAVLVFSIGLLGLASLQILNLKLSHDSLLKATATVLAKDMADRMRANPSQVALGLSSPYNNPLGNQSAHSQCISRDSSSAVVNVSCNPAEMANHDFYEWYASLQGNAATSWYPATQPLLPGANGIVCIDSTPEDGAPPPGDPACDGVVTTPGRNVFTIKIWWSERKDTELSRSVMSLSL